MFPDGAEKTIDHCRSNACVRRLSLLLALLSFATAAAGGTAGCGKPAPAQAASTLQIDGVQRDFILVVPEGYQAERPHALVFAFHGHTDSNSQVRSYFRLESAAGDDVLFIYPAATRDARGYNHWWKRHDRSDALRDYALFDKLLAMMSEQYCVDPERVYLVGHSLGATFANSLACARADRVRAVASVAGGIQHRRCSGRVAAMLLHNPKDDLVKIAEGERARDAFIDNNELAHDSVAVEPRDLNCERYGAADDPEPVIWCPHHQDLNGHKRYYPHNWPKETAAAAFGFFAGLPTKAPAAGAGE